MTAAKLQLRVEDGWAILPSSLRTPTSEPRFRICFPPDLSDEGARHLIAHEMGQGYEPPTRNLIERTLRRGDWFVDVGAHWGFFTLQAASHPCGDVRVVAFEPDPWNATILFKNILTNGVAQSAFSICAACGDRFDIAPLVSNSSMGHSIRGVGLMPHLMHGPSKWVPVVTLDDTLDAFPESRSARLVLKIDAEGFEPQVIAGARRLLEARRIASIIWERGAASALNANRAALGQMVDLLDRRGFRHFRPPDQHLDGPLVPFSLESPYVGNVFSLGDGIAAGT